MDKREGRGYDAPIDGAVAMDINNLVHGALQVVIDHFSVLAAELAGP